jgi:hypothetical protein
MSVLPAEIKGEERKKKVYKAWSEGLTRGRVEQRSGMKNFLVKIKKVLYFWNGSR